jgi:hypothetical protein
VKSKITELRKIKPVQKRNLRVTARKPIERPAPVEVAEPAVAAAEVHASPAVHLEVFLPPAAVAAVVPEVAVESPVAEAALPEADAPAAALEEAADPDLAAE